MERELYTVKPVLDKGFVRVVDYMGNDASVCQAARTSYGEGTTTINGDVSLIRYLMRHWHTTPFEMCEVKLHVKLPIFVARQWIRHRTASVNEYSARYSVMKNEFYVPAPENLAAQSKTNKQGRDSVLEGDEALRALGIIEGDSQRSYDHYEQMIEQGGDNGQKGLARELARINLPTNIYTEWYWKVNLHNLFHFLRLRADPHAQYEIREYAKAICEIVENWVPHCYSAFVDYRLKSETFSAQEVDLVKASMKILLDAGEVTGRDYHKLIVEDLTKKIGLSGREKAEFIAKIFQ
jgi:thymidylate synthase (FAD)